jgi:hypothetical protein
MAKYSNVELVCQLVLFSVFSGYWTGAGMAKTDSLKASWFSGRASIRETEILGKKTDFPFDQGRSADIQ